MPSDPPIDSHHCWIIRFYDDSGRLLSSVPCNGVTEHEADLEASRLLPTIAGAESCTVSRNPSSYRPHERPTLL